MFREYVSPPIGTKDFNPPGLRTRAGFCAAGIILSGSVGIVLVGIAQQEPNTATHTSTGISSIDGGSASGAPLVPDALSVRPPDQPLPQEPILQERVLYPLLGALLEPHPNVQTNIRPDLNSFGRSIYSKTYQTDTHRTTIEVSAPNNTAELNWTTVNYVHAFSEQLASSTWLDDNGDTKVAEVECRVFSLNGRVFWEALGIDGDRTFNTQREEFYHSTSPLPLDERLSLSNQANHAASASNTILRNLT